MTVLEALALLAELGQSSARRSELILATPTHTVTALLEAAQAAGEAKAFAQACALLQMVRS